MRSEMKRSQTFDLLSIFAVFMIFCSSPLWAEIPKNVIKRDGYSNSKLVFEKTQKGTVAFLGGSITEMNGYRPLLCKYLQKKFPETQFKFIDAGISSTCSMTGAFRLDRDILAQGPIDLFFIEFAVNDDQDAHHEIVRSIRGMEGIIRRLRAANPAVDIVMTFFVNEPIMAAYRAGDSPKSIKAHELVAERYGISVINLAKEITERIDAKKLTWKEFGGVHPAPLGNGIAVQMISALLEDSWSKTPKDAAVVPYTLPAPLDRFSYDKGRFLPFTEVNFEKPWTLGVPDWKNIEGFCRKNYIHDSLLCCSEPGASCQIPFRGSAIGAFVLAGPDSGTAEFRIDAGPWKKCDFYHSYSAGLQYPRSVMFDDELSSGTHRLTLRVSSQKNEKSKGTALRILRFEVNDDAKD